MTVNQSFEVHREPVGKRSTAAIRQLLSRFGRSRSRLVGCSVSGWTDTRRSVSARTATRCRWD